METRNITIMLTDIKGFTSKTAGFSRAQTQEMLAKHKELVLPVIEKFGGRLVKTIGDAFLVAFNSPTDAVICGVEVQSVLRAHNEDKAHSEKIEIRIAINSGEVVVHDDGDIYGDAVNITSRLESIAEAGEVFFTESVYLSMNKKEVPSSEIGYRQFKGIPEKIKVFRVLRETPVGAQPPGEAGAEAAGTVPADTPAAGIQAAGQADPAGFWRRLAALGLDVIFFFMITSTLGLQSCGGEAKFDTPRLPSIEGMKVKDVNISKQGLEIAGKEGEKVLITKEGTSLTGRDGKTVKTERRLKLEREKSRVPVGMLLWALYGSLLVWRFAATPGKMILKLKVVDFATGEKLGADKAFLRAFFSLVSLFLLLGYAWALWEKNGRTWHDIIAGSRVIKA